MQRKYLFLVVVAFMVAAAGYAVAAMDQTGGCDGKTSKAKVSSCTKTAGTKTCSPADAANCSKSSQASCCPSNSRQAHYAQVKEIANNVTSRNNSRLVVAGTFQCGMCDLKTTSKCQAFIKTADGKMLPLAHNKKVKDMHMSKDHDIKVTGRVTTEGGIKFLKVTSYKTL